MRDLRLYLVSVGLLAMLPAAAQAMSVDRFGGHLGLGYSHLLVHDEDPSATEASFSPGGSLSVDAGVDYPIASSAFRVGVDIGFALLGSRTVERETQIANLDYSSFEAALFVHYTPQGWGPIGRISLGPALVSARAELATSGGGLAFTDLATEEVAPAGALDVTLITTKPSPVRAGVVLGMRQAFLETETWTLISARLAIHY